MRPNHVWATHISDIPMASGGVYLVADRFSREVLAWRVSITMEPDVCVEALEEALACYSTPEIFNTDQGSQFTSLAFTSVPHREEIAISMDGRGGWCANVVVDFVLPSFSGLGHTLALGAIGQIAKMAGVNCVKVGTYG